jgi:hypothetical protein
MIKILCGRWGMAAKSGNLSGSQYVAQAKNACSLLKTVCLKQFD